MHLLAHIRLDTPPRGLTGGGSCNIGMSGMSTVFLCFLILVRATAPITITETSAHTTSTPPTPADTAVIRVFGSFMVGSSMVGSSVVGSSVTPKVGVVCSSLDNVGVGVGLGLGLDAVYRKGLYKYSQDTVAK